MYWFFNRVRHDQSAKFEPGVSWRSNHSCLYSFYLFFSFYSHVHWFFLSFVRSLVPGFLHAFVCPFNHVSISVSVLLLDSLSTWRSPHRGSYLWPLNLSFITQQSPAALKSARVKIRRCIATWMTSDLLKPWGTKTLLTCKFISSK